MSLRMKTTRPRAAANADAGAADRIADAVLLRAVVTAVSEANAQSVANAVSAATVNAAYKVANAQSGSVLSGSVGTVSALIVVIASGASGPARGAHRASRTPLVSASPVRLLLRVPNPRSQPSTPKHARNARRAAVRPRHSRSAMPSVTHAPKAPRAPHRRRERRAPARPAVSAHVARARRTAGPMPRPHRRKSRGLRHVRPRAELEPRKVDALGLRKMFRPSCASRPAP